MKSVSPIFHLLGERALLVTLSDRVSVETNRQVLRISQAVEEAGIPGVGEAQPAYSSLCVYFDPSRVRASWLTELVARIIREDCEGGQETGSLPGRLVEVPVVYGEDEGPDLLSSALELGISASELVARHTSRNYRVYMVGFTPGFPYLGGMDDSIALPRLAKPRAKVPPGSVGIGGNQTGVYPWETPGGWRILGRTGLELFSPHREDPSLLHPGDTVRFVPVSRDSDAAHAPADNRSPGAGLAGPSRPTVDALEVLHPGFFTIVVDEGRPGYRKLGVPVSGAADARSYRRANLLVGNHQDEAALEMTLLGAKFQARLDCLVAFTGARAQVQVDGVEAGMDRPIPLPAGSVVEIGPFAQGCRGYLSILGGFDVPLVMGSRSTYVRGRFGGLKGRALKQGDTLAVGPAPMGEGIPGGDTVHLADSLFPSVTPELEQACLTLRVTEGPESEPALMESLCSGEYTVNPESDRMGLRLTGPKIAVGKGDILSSTVIPGLIEVPADGRPLLLLCDCQTTGGYKRAAVVVEEDLPLAAQLRPGARVQFRRAR